MSLISKLPIRADEQLLELVRPMPVHSWSYLFGLAVLGINAFFSFWLWQRGVEGRIFNGLVWLFGLYIIYYTWFRNNADLLVISSQRVFDIHRRSFFNETVSSLSLLEIADVVVERSGLLSKIFNYGLLTVHPLQGGFTFEIKRVKRPEGIQGLLLEKRNQNRRDGELVDKEIIYKKMLKIIPELSEAELTLLYQRVHRQLLSLAEPSGGGDEIVV